MPRSNGSTGSTTAGFLSRSATCPRPRQKTPTTPPWRSRRSLPDSNQPASDEGGAVHSGLTGLVVLGLAQMEVIRLPRWEEISQLACGVWLVASPFIFDYAHQDHLRYWHWVFGGLV